MIPNARLADVFVETADTLVADFDLVDFLDHLTDHVAAVSGADAVGLVLDDARGRLQFMAASNDAGKALELFQLQSFEGPCLDAFNTQQPVVNADLGRSSDIWPSFAPMALAGGFSSVHAFPMRLRDDVIGALNLFGRAAASFDPEEIRIVQSLADIATIAILQERTIAHAEFLSGQLQGALNSRIVIEQAKGALSRIEGVSVDEAFVIMRDRARSQQTRLVDIARDILET
jgi:GAF domain-containing protein